MSMPMTRMLLLLLFRSGAGGLARHLRIRARSAAGQVVGGGHVTTRARSSRLGRPAAVSCSRHPYPGGPPIPPSGRSHPPDSGAGDTMPFNNAAERQLRGVALGRKAWMFAGSDRGGERAAAMYSLIATAKLNDIDPRAWLADVLARIADHPASRLHELLPWNWKAA
eukprot:Opistho-1_new@39631